MKAILSLLVLAFAWGPQPLTDNPWIGKIMQPEKGGVFRGISFGMSESEVRTTDPSPYVINKKGGSMQYTEALSADFPPDQFGLSVTYKIDKATKSVYNIYVIALLKIDNKELDQLVHDFQDFFAQMGGAPEEDDSGRVFDYEFDNDGKLQMKVVPQNEKGLAQLTLNFAGQPADGMRDEDAAAGDN